MNLLLHGLEAPQIDAENSLRFALNEIGDRDRVDVILTNPPFGGEEERGILSNFPYDMQTTETALLFLQLIMRKLRRGNKLGRAAVVVPDGILSQEGIASRVRASLVDDYRLHTIVRLPRGVFEPYTKSSTSVLFFDTGEPLDDVWYYEIPLRSDLKAYTQNRPFVFEECIPALDWWGDRKESDCAWKVSRSQITERNYSLNFRNPTKGLGYMYSGPENLIASISSQLSEIVETMRRSETLWSEILEMTEGNSFESLALSELITQVKRDHILRSDEDYDVLAMSWYAKGMYIKHRKTGTEIKAKKLYRIEEGDFVYNRLFAWKGSFAEALRSDHGCFVSNEFPTFRITDSRIYPGYLWAYFSQPAMWDFIESLSTGTTSTSRLRLKEARFLNFVIPVPPKGIQKRVAQLLFESLKCEKDLKNLAGTQTHVSPAVLERTVPSVIL